MNNLADRRIVVLLIDLYLSVSFRHLCLKLWELITERQNVWVRYGEGILPWEAGEALAQLLRPAVESLEMSQARLGRAGSGLGWWKGMGFKGMLSRQGCSGAMEQQQGTGGGRGGNHCRAGRQCAQGQKITTALFKELWPNSWNLSEVCPWTLESPWRWGLHCAAHRCSLAFRVCPWVFSSMLNRNVKTWLSAMSLGPSVVFT